MRDRIDLRDVEHVRDDRVSRRSTPLRRDLPLLAEANDVPVDEKELGKAASLDHVELVRELTRHARRHLAVFRARALLAERIEEAERGLPVGRREAGKALASSHRRLVRERRSTA